MEAGGKGPVGSGKAPADPDKGLADLIKSLRSGEAEAPGGEKPPPAGPAKAPGSGKGAAKEPPARDEPPGGASGGDAPSGRMGEYLLKRLEAVEAELARERERSAEARARLEAKDANRGEVEEQIRAISEALKRERESSHARGRIEALEDRLDRMHASWSEALDDKLGTMAKQLSDNIERAGRIPSAAADRMKSLEERLGALEETISSRLSETAISSGKGYAEVLKLLKMISDQIGSLGPALSDASGAREESLKRIEQVGMALAGLLDNVAPRLGARLDRAAAEIRDLVRRLDSRVLEGEIERVDTLAPLLSGALSRLRAALGGAQGAPEIKRAADLASALETALSDLRTRLRRPGPRGPAPRQGGGPPSFPPEEGGGQ